MEKRSFKNYLGKLKRSTVALAASALAAALAVTAFAWLYHGRRLAAVSEISTPTAIYINAGNRESIRYLTLSGIDVTGEDTYKDYVFCVSGTDVVDYMLQLAYTTNNQFEYELYHAELSPTASSPAGNGGEVIYFTHPTQIEQHYYIPAGVSALDGEYLNKNDDAAEILAFDNDRFYSEAYATYQNVHKYAAAVYWQATGMINAGYSDPSYAGLGDFCDYYILRVKWDVAKANAEAQGRFLQNNKETDIIYIAARNISA